MQKHFSKRLLSLVLAVVLCLGLVPAAAATGDSNTPSVTVEKVDNRAPFAGVPNQRTAERKRNENEYAATDVVRVSIVLEKEGTIAAGYAPQNIARNHSAMVYRNQLQTEQISVAAAISKATQSQLDVVWNLTLAANIISANVKYGDIKTIEAVKGVKEVLIETRYEPCVVKDEGGADPNMATSGKQIGSAAAYLAGYTGAGSRIAIIDTGTDTDHLSFDAAAYEYALSVLAKEAGMAVDAYVESLNLLDAEEIAAVADKLNAANPVYINSKLPYGYNYVDGDTNVIHLNDGQGEHGSHVAGIATANSYVADGEGGFKSALDAVHVQGVAPDAQLLTMKVFGRQGGAYDSDYMAAIEDAIVLDCDAINLSLGSGNPGFSRSSTAAYQEIMTSLVDSGVVVAMSAGNAGYWAEYAETGIPYLYLDDVSMQTNGSPGSFTNALTVASVDNDGWTATAYLMVGEKIMSYTETTDYSNQPMTILEGKQEFVFLDAIGTPEQWEALGIDLTGKIAVCYRGETSFFEKANAAAERGAIGVIIVNNQDGIINMDLTGYLYTAPCVSVTQASGEYFKAVGKSVTGEGVTGWTGSMEVFDGLASGQYESEYYTMSAFSSWGLPGSLELKPEITAPGGDIYSVAGANQYNGEVLFADHASYELMSGTSMASPQVAGMSALMAQYIREKGLAEKTGLNERTLAQSLLMSTAVPIRDAQSDGNYYPVIQQGAGLANVGFAVTADSYILMDKNATASYADGKVKAELGDDPDKNGVYTFSFTINNLTGEEKRFVLSADVFTQDYLTESGILLMDTQTTPLAPAVFWTADGKPVETAGRLPGMDFNGDGIISESDGQALLDYATGLRTKLTNQDKADLDQDGDVDSNDAYLFFSLFIEGSVSVPANGSVSITATISLTSADKEKLAVYENGAYIEAYVYAESLATAEGVAGTVHSIPVLAFYGDWSAPSMFDKGSYVEYYYWLEDLPPYLYQSNYLYGYFNTLTVYYGGEYGAYNPGAFHFGGNPLLDEEQYLPERNSINSENGTKLGWFNFTNIRNAADSYMWIKNAQTGEYYMMQSMGPMYSAYFYVNGGYWNNTGWSLDMDRTLDGIPEDTALEVGLTLVPEYYVMDGGEVDIDALGDGATFSMPMVVDNTAPVADVESAVLDGKTLTLKVKDNRYIAAVAFLDATGTTVMSIALPDQTEEGEEVTVTLDLEDAVGKSFEIQVYDYALNYTTYKVSYDLMPDLDAYYMFYDMGKPAWYGYTEDGSEHAVMGYSGLEIFAAEYVDGYVFAFDVNNDLYVMPDNDFGNVVYVTHAQDDGPLAIVDYSWVTDMAYNPVDGQMYFLVYSISNYVMSPYLYTVDLDNGAITLLGELPEDIPTLAIDDEGNFYGQSYDGGDVWKYTAETYTEPENLGALPFELSVFLADYCALAWDSKNGKLVYSIDTGDEAGLYLIDPTDLSYELLATHVNSESLVGIYVRNWEADPERFAPTNEVDSIILSASELELHCFSSVTLDAIVTPWYVSDRSVTWTSSDENVVSVDANGVVTAHNPGQAVITATSALDKTMSATCAITVPVERITLSGLLQDEAGTPLFYEWDMENARAWEETGSVDTSMTSATYDKLNKKLYVMDDINGVWNMNLVNPETGEVEETYTNTTGVPLWDMEYSTVYSTQEAPLLHGIYYYYFLPAKNPAELDTSAFGLSSYLAGYTGASYLTAITSAGYYAYEEEDGTVIDTELVIMLDNAGFLWYFWIYPTAEGYSAMLNYVETTLDCSFPGNGENMYTSMVVGQDGHLYVSAYTGDTNEVYRLAFNEETGVYEAVRLGDFGQDVWPAILLSVSENGEGTLNVPAETIAQISTENISAEEMRAAAAAANSAPETAGNLNSAVTSIEIADKTIMTLELTAMNSLGVEVAATNGVQTVTYSPSILELVGVTVNGRYYSVNRQSDEGKVTIGYVDLNGIPAGQTTATLIFEVISPITTVITVEHKEANDDDFGYVERVKVQNAIPGFPGIPVPSVPSKPDEPNTPEQPDEPDEPEQPEQMKFVDVTTNDWFCDEVKYVFENGLMNGMSETLFAPYEKLNRAMMWTILARMDGVDTTGGAEWYTKGLEWAMATGVSDGTDPSGNITREQAVTMLYRFSGEPAVSGDYLATFSDADEVSDWALDAMNWAVSIGLIRGDDTNSLNPGDSASRAEIAAMIFRYLED